MRNRTSRWVLVALRGIACLALAGVSCSTQEAPLAGGGSRGGNPVVVGLVVRSDSLAGSSQQVLLIPSDYNPVSENRAGVHIDTTDESGAFSFENIAPGTYNVECNHRTDGTRLLRTNIALSLHIDTVGLGPLPLSVPGTIIIPLTSDVRAGGHVFIDGTTRYMSVPQTAVDAGCVVFDSVAPAAIPRLSYVSVPGGSPVVIDTQITVPENDTALADALPSGWYGASIGETGARGSVAFINSQAFVTGGGPDIWAVSDGFHMAYQPADDTCQIVARVIRHEDTVEFAKAGIMIRETLDPSSRMYVAFLERTCDAVCRKAAGAVVRANPGDSAVDSRAVGQWNLDAPPPYWLKVVRNGSVFESYSSPDGNSWGLISSETVHMGRSVFIGLAVTSHDTRRLNTAVLDNISVQQ